MSGDVGLLELDEPFHRLETLMRILDDKFLYDLAQGVDLLLFLLLNERPNQYVDEACMLLLA